VLDWQKQTREIVREQDRARMEYERVMLKAQWTVEQKREKEAEHERYILNLERNKELIQHNQQEKQLREQAELSDKQRDLQLLNAQLEYAATIEQLEHDERMRHRREAVELQKFSIKTAGDKAAYEKMIDALVQEENEKQWDMREQQWDREDAARINLLKNVYKSREQDMKLKAQGKTESEWMKQYERQNMETEVERQNQAYEDQMVKTSLTKKSHQTDILRQVGERDRTMRRDLQEIMYEERAAKLAELEYQRRIQTEKDNNNNMLNTWKSTVNGH